MVDEKTGEWKIPIIGYMIVEKTYNNGQVRVETLPIEFDGAPDGCAAKIEEDFLDEYTCKNIGLLPAQPRTYAIYKYDEKRNREEIVRYDIDTFVGYT